MFEALGKRGVMSIPIKGIFLSEEVYPDISFRMITDIDLLIRGEDLMMAEKALIELGYCRDYTLREDFFPENCYTLHMEKGEKNGQRFALNCIGAWPTVGIIHCPWRNGGKKSLLWSTDRLGDRSMPADRQNLQEDTPETE